MRYYNITAAELPVPPSLPSVVSLVDSSRVVGELVEVPGAVVSPAVEDVRPHLRPVLLVRALGANLTVASGTDSRFISNQITGGLFYIKAKQGLEIKAALLTSRFVCAHACIAF